MLKPIFKFGITALLSLAFISSGCLLIMLLANKNKEPHYEEKSLSSYLLDIEYAGFGPGGGLANEAEESKAVSAVKTMGTNTLPILIEWLSCHDGALRRLAIGAADKQSLVNLHLISATEKHQLSKIGFAILGKDAAPAISGLLDVLRAAEKAGDRGLANRAMAALGDIGADAAPAVPLLNDIIRTDRLTGSNIAANALAKICGDQKEK